MSVEVAIGDAALERLDDAGFVDEWERLRAACPWASTFQSFAFVDCWYRFHDSLYEPIIVEGRDIQGRLAGLLTLARRRTGRSLVGAGDIHAEYQTWISTAAAAEPFMQAALDRLERSYPRGRLYFKYLSPGTPVEWAQRRSTWPRRIYLASRTRGVMDLSDPIGIDASLRKGHNRSRLNSLRRSGEVRLETIDTVEELTREIDEIAVLCDLRQGAVNDSLPFRSNPLKRPLHLELMKRGLLHVTILRVGSTIASAHLDLKNGNEALIYLIAHAPALARSSPGSLHILLLARELAGQGIARYDLSPGGGYKDRYATDREIIHRMTVQFGFLDRIVAALTASAVAGATTALSATGRTPRAAQREVYRLRAGAMKRFSRQPDEASRRGDIVLFELPDSASGTASDRLALDDLGDLLAYDAGRSGGLSMQRFLLHALHRLESGHRVLTRMDGPLLAECWWLCRLDGPSGAQSAADARDLATASTLLLYAPAMLTGGVGSEAGPDILERLGRTLRGIAPVTRAFLAVSASDVTLVGSLVGAGALRVGRVNPRSVAPISDDAERDSATAGVSIPLELLMTALAGGWPADRPDAR